MNSPCSVFLPLPVRDDVADALRAAGHRVLGGSVDAFELCDVVVIVSPWSWSATFFAGAARGRGALLLALREGPAPEVPTLERFARATVASVAELVELLGRWHPVARTFDPAGETAAAAAHCAKCTSVDARACRKWRRLTNKVCPCICPCHGAQGARA